MTRERREGKSVKPVWFNLKNTKVRENIVNEINKLPWKIHELDCNNKTSVLKEKMTVIA